MLPKEGRWFVGLESGDCRPPRATHPFDDRKRLKRALLRRAMVGNQSIKCERCQPEMSRRPGRRR